MAWIVIGIAATFCGFACLVTALVESRHRKRQFGGRPRRSLADLYRESRSLKEFTDAEFAAAWTAAARHFAFDPELLLPGDRLSVELRPSSTVDDDRHFLLLDIRYSCMQARLSWEREREELKTLEDCVRLLCRCRRLVLAAKRTGAACAGCGYDLTGNVSGVCPECGAGYKAAASTGGQAGLDGEGHA